MGHQPVIGKPAPRRRIGHCCAPAFSDPAQPSADKGVREDCDIGCLISGARPLADLQAALEAEREKRLAAERDAKSVRDQIAQLQGEVVVSYGKVTQIGSTLGSVFTEALALVELEKNGELATPEGETRFGKFLEQARSISGCPRRSSTSRMCLRKAAVSSPPLMVPPSDWMRPARKKSPVSFPNGWTEAGAKKLTLANLPARGSAEFHPWLEQRWAFFEESRGQLRRTHPGRTNRSAFDQMSRKRRLRI